MKRLLVAALLLLSLPARANEFWVNDENTSPDGNLTNYTLYTNLGPCVTGALSPNGGLSCVTIGHGLSFAGSTLAAYTTTVANVAALEALTGANYLDGNAVYVQSLSAGFVFHTTNTSTVDHKMIASVSGMANARWIRDPTADGTQWNQLAWFVNTSTGNDENDCVGSGTACATFAEVRRRLLSRYVPIGNTQSITITVAGNLGDQDPIAIDMLLVARNLGSTVTVMGTPTTASLGTIASVTAHNYATNQADEITITGLDWTPYVGKIIRRVGTSGTSGQTSLVEAAVSIGVARVTQVSFFGGPGTAWQVADGVEALTLPKAQGARAGFAGTMIVGNFDFDPSTTAAQVNVTGAGNAIIFGSTIKGSSSGNISDRGGGIAFGGCGFSTRSYSVSGNVSVSWSLLSSVPSFQIANSKVGRNEWQDSILLNSTLTLGEYVHIRFHSLGIYGEPAATAALSLFGGASVTFTDYIYGTGNNATSKVFTLVENSAVAGVTATSVVADNGILATVAGQNLAPGALPYYRDTYGNQITGDSASDLPKHLAVAGRDITGFYPYSDVVGLLETGGPTHLLYAAIPDGSFFKRSGTTVIGDTASYVPTTRTVQGTTPILIAGGTAAVDLSVNRVWSHATSGVTPTSYTSANITVDAFGHITAASNGSGSGGTVTTVTGTAPIFITSTPTTTPNVTIQGSIVSGSASTTAQNLGASTNGTLQQTVSGGVATLSAFAGTTGSVPFYTASSQLAQDNTTFFWDNGNKRLGVGTNAPAGTLEVQGAGTNNTLRIIGTSAISGGMYFQDTVNTAQTVFYIDNNIGAFQAYGGLLNGGSACALGSLFGLARANRLFLFADGASNLGLVVGTLNATSVTFGTNNTSYMVLSSSGELQILAGATQSWYGVGGTNYERVRANWGTWSYSGLTAWMLASEKFGSGTARDIAVDAGTANSYLAGAVASIYGTNTSNRVTASGSLGVELAAAFTRASAASMVLDAIKLSNASQFSITGTTNITTATGVNFVTVQRPVYDGGGSGKTITSAATVYIPNAPLDQNGVTITNPYALWVDDGAVRLDGNTFAGAGASGGYLAVNGVSAATNDALAVGHTGNADRDHVRFFVGGGAGYDTANSFFQISAANTAVLGTLGIWATQRIGGYTISAASGSPTVTEAATLYIDAAPTLSGVTGPTYALHVAAGLALFEGDVTVGKNSSQIGFYGSGGSTLQTITGSRGGNAALASLLTALQNMNLVNDGTSP